MRFERIGERPTFVAGPVPVKAKSGPGGRAEAARGGADGLPLRSGGAATCYPARESASSPSGGATRSMPGTVMAARGTPAVSSRPLS